VQRYFALCLVFVSFFLSAYLSRTVFEQLPHLEDELAYLYQARIFARGDITIDTPNPRTPFWQPFVVDYEGKRFSKYTPGWSAMLSVGVLLGATWWVNAALSALAVALTYRVGEEIFSPDVGLIAAIFVTFSPMHLLLSSSLMGHTAALCCTMLFTYAYWRIEQRRQPLRWGFVAGIALGLLIVNRPLTAVGIVAPFVVFSLLRLMWILVNQPKIFLQHLAPLIILALVALAFTPTIPLYRYIAMGDATLNPYTLVWEYDKVGFGEDVGRYGHTLEKGIEHTLEDFTLTSVDLFGWQFGSLTYEQRQHLLIGLQHYPGRGYSWVLLPFGVIAGLWLATPRRRWTLILIAVPLCVVGVHLAYWIGSQRYSTRYYSEGIAAAAIISAILPGGIASRSKWLRLGVYLVVIGATAYFATIYTFPRIQLLHSYNHVTQVRIDEVNALRQTVKPALVILTGDGMTWRANGTLMGVTSPYLDSDIVLARDTKDGRYRETLMEMFPDREIIDLNGKRSKHWLSLR